MTDRKTDRNKARYGEQDDDETALRKMMVKREGKILLRWLKHKTGFERPVFSEDDRDGHLARIKDGGRQIVCALLNLGKPEQSKEDV